MPEYDVIVVGAGFAGPVAAKKCAEAGLRTLLLERAAQPGHKVISSCLVPITGFLLGPSWLREENPPLERAGYGVAVHYVKGGEVFLTVKTELAMPMGYMIYCRPFCTWEAEKAVQAGAELRTSTAAVDVTKDGRRITGVVTDEGERLDSRVVIDAEGSENLLAIKAGIRRKFPPESIELCLLYDFEMPQADIEDVTGGDLEFYWAMPDEEIHAPPGEGTLGVYVFPYRQSLHLTFGQFLAMKDRKAIASDGCKLIQSYADNFFNIRRWRELIAPKAKLRARVWATAPLYANLDPEVRAMPVYGDGMLIVGDAGGFETSASGNGVDTAWITAEIAADVAIEAIKNNDVSASFLERYAQRCQAHPVMVDLCSPQRRDLTSTQHDLGQMIQGSLGYFTGDAMLRMAELVKTTNLEDVKKLLPLL